VDNRPTIDRRKVFAHEAEAACIMGSEISGVQQQD